MTKSKMANRYSPEARARAVRMVFEHQGSYETQAGAIAAIAPKIGCIPQTLRDWVKQAEKDSGMRDGVTTEERDRIKALERENRELRQANEILRKASAYFCAGGTRPPTEAMITFIDDQRFVYGVESICRVLPIAPSTYYHRLACLADPSKASLRHQRDTELRPEIERVWDENYQVYGVRKAWHQLKREGFDLARCTVERLMKQIGIRGAVRGKVVKTTIPDTSAPCPRDKVNRVFRAPAPNLLWVSDFTYVSTWQGFVLDALEQALHDRRPVQKAGLIHHSDRGGQYLSIRYTERLAEAGIEPSVGSVGDSYDNALAETINGLYKTELVHRQGPWRNMQDLEMATLGWVDWFNNRRLLGPIGNIPPAEAEDSFYAQRDVLDMVA
ncbi:IS3 family transposase [Paracoccus jeotgali]|uniref:IS3 family transposase n=1 Tax=Paracoccus jeotgali TaxID=2065379 RepID=UPI0028AFFDFF|nr:IS3 family transposase [Paracoccus jeotgali]